MVYIYIMNLLCEIVCGPYISLNVFFSLIPRIARVYEIAQKIKYFLFSSQTSICVQTGKKNFIMYIVSTESVFLMLKSFSCCSEELRIKK